MAECFPSMRKAWVACPVLNGLGCMPCAHSLGCMPCAAWPGHGTACLEASLECMIFCLNKPSCLCLSTVLYVTPLLTALWLAHTVIKLRAGTPPYTEQYSQYRLLPGMWSPQQDVRSNYSSWLNSKEAITMIKMCFPQSKIRSMNVVC